MNRSSASLQVFAISGSTLAGFVDAIGFIETNGYFVSFMSGNSTQLGVGVAGLSAVVIPAALVGSFICGVTGGSLIGRSGGDRQAAVVFALVAVLLGVAATLGNLGYSMMAVLVTAVAMGAENAAIEANGEVRIGLTYMTGTLVKLGQNLASGLRGGARWRWVPHLLLWIGMVAGAVAGAVCQPILGSGALWLAASAAAVMAAVGWVWPEKVSA